MKKILYLFALIGLCAACSYPELSQDEFKELTGEFEMVLVQGGTFTMGPTSEQVSGYYSDELPTHSVTLNSFLIGKYEVTQKQWWDVMGSWPSDNPDRQPNATYGKGDNYPMYWVTYYHVQDFLIELNRQTGKNYRLPTEAEWEYAAKGGQKGHNYEYSGSNTIGDVAWYWDNIPSQNEGATGYGTQPVGTKAPNELGIYDMTGNVAEWCSDWANWYDTGDMIYTDSYGDEKLKIMRGGRWDYDAFNCHVSIRLYMPPSWYSRAVGIRLVLDSVRR